MAKTGNLKGKTKAQEKVVFFLDKPGRIEPGVIRQAVLEVKKLRQEKRRAANGTARQKSEKARLS